MRVGAGGRQAEVGTGMTEARCSRTATMLTYKRDTDDKTRTRSKRNLSKCYTNATDRLKDTAQLNKHKNTRFTHWHCPRRSWHRGTVAVPLCGYVEDL